jgi:hypothetical protein
MEAIGLAKADDWSREKKRWLLLPATCYPIFS